MSLSSVVGARCAIASSKKLVDDRPTGGNVADRICLYFTRLTVSENGEYFPADSKFRAQMVAHARESVEIQEIAQAYKAVLDVDLFSELQTSTSERADGMEMLLIFDCDGTLVDTERVYNRAWSVVLHRHGLAWTPGRCAQHLMGRPLEDCLSVLKQELGASLPEGLHAEVACESAKLFDAEGLRPTLGIEEALSRLSQLKCVASSGRLSEVTDNLRRTGLLSHFAERRILVSAMVSRGKPEPDLFLHAAETLGFAPAQCVVVEDSVPGVVGARRAGMTALGFSSGLGDLRALAEAGATPFDDMRLLPSLIERLPSMEQR